MGFGGSTAAMIASLKNNNRRSKREAFEGWTGFDKESQGIKIEPVSEELLQGIRDKLYIQRRKTRIKNMIIILLSTVATIIFFKLMFSYFENGSGISDDFLYRQSNY